MPSVPLPDEVLQMLAFGDVEPAVSLEEFFGPAFMREHTQFEDFDAFREESPWEIETEDDIDALPTDELDDYVARTTAFDTWLEMRNRAAEEAVVDRLMV